MLITEKVNQLLQNDPNLQLLGVYIIDGQKNAFLFDRSINCIIQIYKSKDLFSEDDLPELIDCKFDLNPNDLKELFDDILEKDK